MAKYRRKPVIIDAVRHIGTNPEEITDFFGGDDITKWAWGETYSIQIFTLEGVMTANLMDWIIKGVKGEFYPCKPDIFALIYEPAYESGNFA